jgi:hypothetical protein
MTKLKLFLIGISIGLIPIKNFAQNWQKLGNGATFKVGRLYADTLLNLLYTGKGLMSSGINAIDYWDGFNWDTLRSIDSPIFAINKFQGNLVLSNNKLYRYFNNNWEMLSSEYILGFFNDENNFLYAVGGFDSIGGVAASNIAKWDGINWSAIDTTKWLGAVTCSIIYNNELYIGGGFVNYNGTIDRVARWDGNQWQPVGNGIRGGMGGVNCFEIYNNELYVGGRFNMVENPGNAIAKWDGLNWHHVGGGMTSTNAQIFDLQTYNNELYACGVFTIAGGQQINSIAKWNGTDWCGLGFNASNNGWVYSMAVLNNELFIGGAFDIINGDTMNYVAKWSGGNFTDVCGNTTGMQILDNNEELIILPNPATETIKLLNLAPNESILITDLTGNIVIQTILNETQSININILAKGMYFIQTLSKNKAETAKFIKQ